MSEVPVSQLSANPALGSSTRTRANTYSSTAHPPHEDSDEVSVTNSEVESVMNHRRLKETMRAPVFTELEFTAFTPWMHISEPPETDLLELLNYFQRICR